MMCQIVIVMTLATLNAMPLEAVRNDHKKNTSPFLKRKWIQELKDSAQPLTPQQISYMMKNTNMSKNKMHLTIPGADKDVYGVDRVLSGYENKAVYFTDNYYATHGYTTTNIDGKNLWLAQNDKYSPVNFTARKHAIALRINAAGTGIEAAFITESNPAMQTEQVSMTSKSAQNLKTAYDNVDVTVGLFDNPWVPMKEQSGQLVSEKCSYVERHGLDWENPHNTNYNPEPHTEDGVYKIELSPAN